MNNIYFNDEIIEIEELDERKCIDIEVSDDHFFKANDILVKNSKGIPDTADVFIALIYPKELREQNIQIWKILKNRFGGIVDYKIPFKINYSKVKIIDLKDSGEDAKKIKIYDNDSCNNLKFKKEESRIKEKNSIIVVDECNLDDADSELMEMIGE